MARSIPAAAAAKAALDTGASYRRVLEVRYASGTVYYAAEPMSTAGGDPVDAVARVVEWGTRRVSAEPGRVGGHGQYRVRLADPDLTLLGKFNTSPGITGTPCYVHLWFEGTTWAERVTEFGGFVQTPPDGWDEQSATWDVTLSGFEDFYDPTLGRRITRENFPEVACSDCEGKLIPIAYGNPVRRVPACVVDRPGVAALASALKIHDTTFEINRSAADAGFTVGEEITVAVGFPGYYEIITGAFDSSSDTTFSITSRKAFQAEGTAAGVFASGGVHYMLVDRSDLPEPDQPRIGYPLYLWDEAENRWRRYVTDQWFRSGAQEGILREPADFNITTGLPWKLGRWRTEIHWNTGATVAEVGPWKYVANFLPSAGVERVEAKGEVVPVNGDGNRVTQFFSYDSSFYSVTLDDRTHNAALGRSASDPGVTTVTLRRPPMHYGFSDNDVYVTLRGITSDETSTGTPLTDPVTVIKHLMTSQWLGGVPASRIDAASFAQATVDVTESFALALTDPDRQLNALVGDLAYQAGCLLFWDAGQCYIRRVNNAPTSGDSVLTINNAKRAESGLQIGYVPPHENATEAAGVWKPDVPAPEAKLVRVSAAAVGAYGSRRKEVKLTAYQRAAHVASITELWLTYWLRRQQTGRVRTYLHALAVQPGDIVTLDIDSGAGTALFDSALVRVTDVSQQPGDAPGGRMEAIDISFEASPWSFAVDAAADPEEPPCPVLEEPDVHDQDPTWDNSPEPKPGQPLPPINVPYPPEGVSSSATSSASTASSEACPCNPCFELYEVDGGFLVGRFEPDGGGWSFEPGRYADPDEDWSLACNADVLTLSRTEAGETFSDTAALDCDGNEAVAFTVDGVGYELRACPASSTAGSSSGASSGTSGSSGQSSGQSSGASSGVPPATSSSGQSSAGTSGTSQASSSEGSSGESSEGPSQPPGTSSESSGASSEETSGSTGQSSGASSEGPSQPPATSSGESSEGTSGSTAQSSEGSSEGPSSEGPSQPATSSAGSSGGSSEGTSGSTGQSSEGPSSEGPSLPPGGTSSSAVSSAGTSGTSQGSSEGSSGESEGPSEPQPPASSSSGGSSEGSSQGTSGGTSGPSGPVPSSPQVESSGEPSSGQPTSGGGSEAQCVIVLDGKEWDDLPLLEDPVAFLVGIDANGCYGRIAMQPCPTDSSAGSSGASSAGES